MEVEVVRVFAEQYQKNGMQKAILPTIPRAELNSALNLAPAKGTAIDVAGTTHIVGSNDVAGGTIVL